MSSRATEVLSLALAPVAWAYRVVVHARNRRYDRPGVAYESRLPVLSVGNLVVGGTGKTPTVAWLAAHLVECGLRPAIVSRGYGGAAGRGPVLASSGEGPRCSPRLCGDEPFLLARAVPGAIVVVGSDRVLGAELARAEGAQAVILDDGLQHRRLARDLDIVLLDARRPFGNGRLLPAGPLREPPTALARAGLVLVTRAEPGLPPTEIRRVLDAHRPGVPTVPAAISPVGFVDTRGLAVEAPRRAVAFCGIASPSRFRSDLETLGVEVVAFRAFRDHQRPSSRALAALAVLARNAEARLVTTEKDLARLAERPETGEDAALLALRVQLVVHDPQTVHHAVLRAVRRRAA